MAAKFFNLCLVLSLFYGLEVSAGAVKCFDLFGKQASEHGHSPTKFSEPTLLRERVPDDVVLLSGRKRLYRLADHLARDPKNKALRDDFISTSHKMCNRFEDFHYVAKAYNKLLKGQKGEKLSTQHLELMVEFLQRSHPALLSGPYTSTGTYGVVQRFFSDTLINALRKNRDFHPGDALNIVTWLGTKGIRFSRSPLKRKRFFLGRAEAFHESWILGNILVEAVKTGRDLQKVEDAIVESFRKDVNTLSGKFLFIGTLRKYAGDYRISVIFLKRMRAEFDLWFESSVVQKMIKEESVLTSKEVDVERLSKYSKGVFSLSDFIRNFKPDRRKTVLFGAGSEHYSKVYHGVAEFLNVIGFESAYARMLMTTNMEGLSSLRRQAKTEKFIRRLTAMGYEIIFILPRNIKLMEFTRYELEYFLENPEVRLKNVTFVLGAYGEMGE